MAGGARSLPVSSLPRILWDIPLGQYEVFFWVKRTQSSLDLFNVNDVKYPGRER